MDVARKALILGRLLGFPGELEDIAVESLVPDGAGRLKLDQFLASLEQFDAAWAKRVAAARARAAATRFAHAASRSEEHTSELQSLTNLVCRLLLDKKT